MNYTNRRMQVSAINIQTFVAAMYEAKCIIVYIAITASPRWLAFLLRRIAVLQ